MQMTNQGQKLIKYATVLWSEKKLWQIHFNDKQEACDMVLTIPRELFRPGNKKPQWRNGDVICIVKC
jgi:hypothetical protein